MAVIKVCADFQGGALFLPLSSAYILPHVMLPWLLAAAVGEPAHTNLKHLREKINR